MTETKALHIAQQEGKRNKVRKDQELEE